MMAPKLMSSDAGNSDMPERRGKVLPLSEKILYLVKEKNKKQTMC